MEELDLMPIRLERSKSPQMLGPDEARVLQSVDIGWLMGRMMRGPGVADTQIPNSTTSILSAFVATRRDCRKMVIDCSTAGTCRGITGTNAALTCTGPTNEWGENAGTETTDEDAGVDETGGGCDCCDCCGGGCC